MKKRKLDKKDETTDMQKCSKVTLDWNEGFAIFQLVPGPHSMEWCWVPYLSDKWSECLFNLPDYYLVYTWRHLRTGFYLSQWGILEMCSLIPSGGNSHIVFHLRHVQESLQVRWAPWGKAVLMEMHLCIRLCKHLFLWFMMCLVFPGYMKSN